MASASLILTGTDNLLDADTLALEVEGDTLFTYAIPGADYGTVYSYFIEASDSSGNVSRLPEKAPQDMFQFSVLNSQVPVLSSVNAWGR